MYIVFSLSVLSAHTATTRPPSLPRNCLAPLAPLAAAESSDCSILSSEVSIIMHQASLGRSRRFDSRAGIEVSEALVSANSHHEPCYRTLVTSQTHTPSCQGEAR